MSRRCEWGSRRGKCDRRADWKSETNAVRGRKLGVKIIMVFCESHYQEFVKWPDFNADEWTSLAKPATVSA